MVNEARKAASEPRHEDIHFERTDIFARGVLIAGASVLGGVWVIFGVVYLCFVLLAHHRAEVSPPPLPIEAHGNPMPPEPRLQESPRQDLKAMRKLEDWQLTHYSWVDKSKGTIAIPIERAMDILAQQGIPPKAKPPNLVLLNRRQARA